MKEKKNNNFKTYLYAIIVVLAFISVSIGATFAVHYFVKGNDKTNPIRIKTAYVTAMFEATNSVNSTNILPGWSNELKFVITNISPEENAIGNYTLFWEVEQNDIDSDDFVYTLSCKSFLGEAELEVSDTNKMVNITTPRRIPSASSSIGSGIINTGVRHECVLKLFFKESAKNQDEMQSKTFTAKVYAKGEPNV